MINSGMLQYFVQYSSSPYLKPVHIESLSPICDGDIYFDSMTIGLARGARNTRAPNNFQKLNPIWPPRFHDSIKLAITPSVFVIDI